MGGEGEQEGDAEGEVRRDVPDVPREASAVTFRSLVM
jgi:hypothetical protein